MIDQDDNVVMEILIQMDVYNKDSGVDIGMYLHKTRRVL